MADILVSLMMVLGGTAIGLVFLVLLYVFAKVFLKITERW